jgi:hypothetical protein
MVGIVRWSQPGKFGLQFAENFDVGRLAPAKAPREAVTMLRPWYVDPPEKAAG